MVRGFGRHRGAFAAGLLWLLLGSGPAWADETHVFALVGSQAVPPTRSGATAAASVILKGRTGKLRIRWQGLSGRPIDFEIHGPALAGRTAGLLFSLPAPRHASARADSVEISFPVAQSRKKFFRDEQTYLIVRTSRHRTGEIRGQIIPTDLENDEDD